MRKNIPATNKKSPVRVLKDHEPLLRIDVDRAESLLRDMIAVNKQMFGIYRDFIDTVRFPVAQAASKSGVQPDVAVMLGALKDAISGASISEMHRVDEAQNLMETAVAAMRVYYNRQAVTTAAAPKEGAHA